MALPGDAIITAPSLRIDRSFNKKRNAASNNVTNKTHFPTPTLCGMGYSASTSKISRKMKSLRHNRRDNEVMAPLQQGLVSGAMVSKRKPRHIDVAEALALRERCAPQNQPRQLRYSLVSPSGLGTGHERSRVEIKRLEEPHQNGSHRQVGYNEYLGQAFGLSASQQRRLLSDDRGSPTQSCVEDVKQGWDHDARDERPTHVAAKDRRPKIHLTIPGKRMESHTHIAHMSNKEKVPCKSLDLPGGISPPSPTSRQRQSVEVAPARLSIVSPLSVVEMPKPRRPFSLLSLEDMSLDMPKSAPPMSRSAVSDTSDDTGEHDDRSSNYSARSSMSSLHSDEPLVKESELWRGSLAFSIVSPAAAGVFDSRPVTANFPPKLRITKSNYSLADKVNRNKPLPPAPGVDEVAPLTFGSRPASRTSSYRTGRKVPAPLNVSRQSYADFPSRRVSRVSSLRSKYTPADLDALDDAFRKTSPSKPESPSYSLHLTPTLSQAQLALEAQLGTISEDATLDSDMVPLMHDPLQISRGPMHMEPSRKAPSPPSSHLSSEGGCDSSRKRNSKRPSNHVALQMRASMGNNLDNLLVRRVSASVVGSSVKAHRILGKESASTLMEREGSAESHWSSSDSPKTYSSTSNMSREESQTPDSDLSSIPDAAFEEVRARLELLSPKNDTSATFVAFRERTRQSSESSVRLPIQEQSGTHTPAYASHGTSSEVDKDEVREEQAELTIHLSPVLEDQFFQVHAAPVELKDESSVHPLEHTGLGLRIEKTRPRSLGSIAVSEIPDIYASLPSPIPTLYSSMSAEEVERKILAYTAEQEEAERQISADAAEQVLLRILQNLDNLQDLFATATVSRGFYRTFKRHELPLMKNALFGMSPAAWELREMSPPSETADRQYTPTLYLQHYMRDMYTMIALKSMILIHCESFLRADTITALAGGETDRASQIDDAFWRVWTFCQVFGCGTNKEDDIVSQMDWLRGGALAKQQRKNSEADLSFPPAGFGEGNMGGLTAEDLYDMTEIWTCLGVLVRGFQGKRQEARDFGVFEKADITDGDVDHEDVVLG